MVDGHHVMDDSQIFAAIPLIYHDSTDFVGTWADGFLFLLFNDHTDSNSLIEREQIEPVLFADVSSASWELCICLICIMKVIVGVR